MEQTVEILLAGINYSAVAGSDARGNTGINYSAGAVSDARRDFLQLSYLSRDTPLTLSYPVADGGMSEGVNNLTSGVWLADLNRGTNETEYKVAEVIWQVGMYLKERSLTLLQTLCASCVGWYVDRQVGR